MAPIGVRTPRRFTAEILRGLIEEIRLTPSVDGDRLGLELYGHLAATLALTNDPTANRPGSGDPRRFSLVAGERNPRQLTLPSVDL
jgi:hypothetical protein